MKKYLFRGLTISAIVFAAGISGAWLSEQFTAPLPAKWGFFGALIIGIAIYGGVALGTHGDRKGYIIAALGSVAEIVFGFWYFAHAHDPVTSLVLGIVPTGIAIMGGLVENSVEVLEQADAQLADALAWERKRQEQADQRAHDEKLARIQANAQARIEKARIEAESATPQPTTDPAPKTVPTPAEKGTLLPKPARLSWLAEQDHVTVQDLVARWGYSDRSARKDLAAANFSKNGDGSWHRT